MPMKLDPQGGGTEADGSRSAKYCSYCYRDGAFLFDGTMREYQEICRKAMVEHGYNRIFAWLFTRFMGRLERWKGK